MASLKVSVQSWRVCSIAATKAKLHWGAYLHTDSAARDAKLAAMVVDDEFESVVVSHIDDWSLKCVAKCLRALFLQGV